ncbi:metabotropic glutamate receptor 5-like [Atheta coriaria]|uniref:metabotropic glutamate receptor 5-like n=1 Tax=Dalotia coriaria TaxID=877792 RepID=UPI0031F3388D
MNGVSLFCLVVCFFPLLESATTPQEEQQHTAINGNFMIGALFPIHHMPQSKQGRKQSYGIKCGEIREQYGIQRIEVALHTIDKINDDQTILPNITLGIEIRDDCWYAPVALQQSIELIRETIAPASIHHDSCLNITGSPRIKNAKGPLIGVVSPGSSSVALQVQNLLQLFHLPQIGYSTTSKDLSDKSRFNYFLRVVPSDYFQAQVMLDVVRFHEWTYVSIVNTDENYGQSGIQAFRELAEEADVCIAREDSVLSNSPEDTFDKVIINLRQDPNAYVVVCFCEGFTVRGLLAATKRLNMSNHFLFIGSDGWADRADVTQGLEEQAWGSISIRIHSPYVNDFDNYYWGLTPSNNARNPWFNEFWQFRFGCTLPDDATSNRIDLTPTESTQDEFDSNENMNSTMSSSTVKGNQIPEVKNEKKRICTGREDLSDGYRQDPKLSFVIKAINSFAYGLHNMQQDLCGQDFIGMCDKLLPFNGSLFKNYLLNVSFDYHGDPVEFDENGDPPGRYDIMNYQRLGDDTYDYVHVGDWNNRSLGWVKPVQFGPRAAVHSVCSQKCPMGHYKNIQLGGKDKRCCWVCVKCPAGEILDQASDSLRCEKCPLGFSPDANQTVCLRLDIVYTQWFDTQAIVAMVFASLGFVTTWFSLAIFVLYNNTPVVKSSTKELSYIILVGMMLSHGSIFAILAKPSLISCALTRFLPGLSFAMIYAALLTKTNRIARILAVSKKCFPTRKRLFMSSASQVVITTMLIAIECLISIWMLFYQRPDIAHSYHSNKTVLECNTTPEGVVTPLAFDFFLILLCTLYALKTRNVPENFNEAKFIGFAMYTTCVIWIAFVPIYFGSDSKVITMCMCVTLSATVTWTFLFIPKLYIIILRPERNNRSYFTTSKSIRCHIGSKVSTAVSTKSSVNSWRDNPSATSTTTTLAVANQQQQNIKETAPHQRSFACQTGLELLQVLLSPKILMDTYSPKKTVVPRITERNCCDAPSCCYKKITIRLPESSDA